MRNFELSPLPAGDYEGVIYDIGKYAIAIKLDNGKIVFTSPYVTVKAKIVTKDGIEFNSIKLKRSKKR